MRLPQGRKQFCDCFSKVPWPEYLTTTYLLSSRSLICYILLIVLSHLVNLPKRHQELVKEMLYNNKTNYSEICFNYYYLFKIVRQKLGDSFNTVHCSHQPSHKKI